MFGDTFKTVKSLSESVYQVPKSVQQSIPIYRISQNGIFEIEKKNGEHVFDKAYVLEDVNGHQPAAGCGTAFKGTDAG